MKREIFSAACLCNLLVCQCAVCQPLAHNLCNLSAASLVIVMKGSIGLSNRGCQWLVLHNDVLVQLHMLVLNSLYYVCFAGHRDGRL